MPPPATSAIPTVVDSAVGATGISVRHREWGILASGLAGAGWEAATSTARRRGHVSVYAGTCSYPSYATKGPNVTPAKREARSAVRRTSVLLIAKWISGNTIGERMLRKMPSARAGRPPPIGQRRRRDRRRCVEGADIDGIPPAGGGSPHRTAGLPRVIGAGPPCALRGSVGSRRWRASNRDG